MLPALLVAADLASSFTLADRSELRLRVPGTVGITTVPLVASADVETALDARLSQRSRRARYALGYAPRLTVWDLNAPQPTPTFMHAGTLKVERWSRLTRMSLDEAASYGGINFAALAPTYGADGAQAPPDVIPASRVIQYVASSTTVASHLTFRRSTVDLSAGYQLSGGANAIARGLMPFQAGPLGEARTDYAISRQDHTGTTLSATEASFSPIPPVFTGATGAADTAGSVEVPGLTGGPESLLVELDQQWLHRWSRVTETRFTLGVAESRARAGADAPDVFATHPVAEGVLEQRRRIAEGLLDVRLDLRVGPVVNRLLGNIDERFQGTLAATHTRGRLATAVSFGVLQSLPPSGVDAIQLFTADAHQSYRTSETVSVDLGVRGLWQSQEATQAAYSQGTAFVGLSFRAPEARF
jgi:hypothetical protein